MSYLLPSLIIVYAVLAALVYDRRPEAISNRILSYYLGTISIATIGLLVIKIAAAPAEAAFGVRVALALLATANAITLPYTVVSLHFERLHQKFNLRIPVYSLSILIACAVYLVGLNQPALLVEPAAVGYGIVHLDRENATLALMVLLSLAGGTLTVAMAVAGAVRGHLVPRRLGWLYPASIVLGGAAGYTLFVSLGDEQTGHPVGLAVAYIPLIALFLFQIVRFRRSYSLPRILDSLTDGKADGTLVLDAKGAVVWASEGVHRLLGVPVPGTVNISHVKEWLGASPLWPCIETLLASGETCTSVENTALINGDERVIRVTYVRLDAAPDYPDLRVFMFYDGTTAAIRRALTELHTEKRRLRRHSDILYEVTRIVNSDLDLDRTLTAILARLQHVIDYDRAAVILIDSDGQPQVRAHTGFSEAIDWQCEAHRIAKSALLREILTTKQALLLSDAQDDARGEASPTTHETRAFIGAPLIVRDQVIGILSLDSAVPRTYDTGALETVQAFAEPVAALIHNRRLLDRATARSRDLETLNAIAAATAESLDLGQLLRAALHHITGALDLPGAMIHLNDRAGETLVLAAQHNIAPEVIDRIARVKWELIPYRETLKTQQLLVLPPTEDRPQTWVGVLLVVSGETLGALSVTAPPNETFSSERLSLLTGMANQVALAIANAMRYQIALERERVSERLALLGLALGKAMDEAELLRLVCRESKAIFNVDGAVIWFIDDDALAAVASCGAEVAVEQGMRIPLDWKTAPEAKAIAERRPIYENRVAQRLPAKLLDWRNILGVQSQISAPLRRETDQIGAITLFSAGDPGRFGPTDLEMVNLLTVQVSLALQNTRQTAEISRRLRYERLVNEVGRRVTAILQSAELIRSVCRQIYSAFGYDIIALFLVEDAQIIPRAIFLDGAETDISALDFELLPVWAVKQAVAQRDMVRTSAALRIQTDRFDKSGRTDLALPMVLGSQVTGALAVARYQDSAINENEQEVLQILTAQLAIALSNARLFEEARQYRAELECRVCERTAEIAAQRDQTQAILCSVADAVIVADLNGAITLTNPPAANLLADRQAAVDFEQWLAAIAGEAAKTELKLKGRIYQPTVSPVVQDGVHTGTVIVLHDITRHHELDQLKSKFVAAVSHELRTPLTNIRLYISLLKQGRPERHEHYLSVVDREAMRLDGLVRDLLDLSRLEGQRFPTQREELDIDKVIRVVLDNLGAQAEARELFLSYESTGAPPSVYANRNQLMQLFTNLIANAIAYTDPGGQVWVRVR
ncbi:MAG: GAF domain-containing protein, partial [Anaerolineae bacterium]|nr:GAF domain-containing protein [Anaerolineae bacterium]